MTWTDAIPALIKTAQIVLGVFVILGAGMVIVWLNREPWNR